MSIGKGKEKNTGRKPKKGFIQSIKDDIRIVKRSNERAKRARQRERIDRELSEIPEEMLIDDIVPDEEIAAEELAGEQEVIAEETTEQDEVYEYEDTAEDEQYDETEETEEVEEDESYAEDTEDEPYEDEADEELYDEADEDEFYDEETEKDEAEIARESIRHIRTGGIPDSYRRPRPKRRRRKPSAKAIREARKREKKKKRYKSVALAGIVAFFAVGAYFSRSYWVPKLEGILDRPKQTIVNDGKVKEGNFPLYFGEGSVSSISSSGSCLLCLDKNQLRIYNEDGEETSSFSHNYADPVLRATDKRMLIYDKGGSSMMVVGRTNQMFSKAVKNRIIMADIAPNNNVAVVTDDERYAGILTVYDGNGREIFKWSSGSQLLSLTFDEDGGGCYVTTFAGMDGTLCSVMRYFRFDEKEPRVTSDPLPVLALQAMENDNGEFWVVGDTAFMRLDRKGRVLSRYDYMGKLDDFALDRSCAALIFKGIERRSSRLELFDSDSDRDEPDKIVNKQDGTPVRMKMTNGKMVILKDRQVDCYDFEGNLLATAECSSDYTDFVYFGDNVYFKDYREVNKISFTT